MTSMAVETSERRRAVADCITDVKAIVRERGVERDALEQVKARLLALAAKRDLFSFAAFPLQHQGSTLHLLSEDADHGFALYAVAARSASRTPPHDHTTWAVVVGVEGEELNRHYRRLDDGPAPGKARLEATGETLVKEGTGVALMPDDIHSIERTSDAPMLHFHLYGRSLEHLPARRQFDMTAGSSRSIRPAPTS